MSPASHAHDAGVGTTAGAADGESLGRAVGFFVGGFVGATTGADDGESLGRAVGFFVGGFVGPTAGAADGESLGRAVGFFVGGFVGFLVGGSVGGFVGTGGLVGVATISSASQLPLRSRRTSLAIGGGAPKPPYSLNPRLLPTMLGSMMVKILGSLASTVVLITNCS